MTQKTGPIVLEVPMKGKKLTRQDVDKAWENPAFHEKVKNFIVQSGNSEFLASTTKGTQQPPPTPPAPRQK